MTRMMVGMALLLLPALPARAADTLSGTWTAGAGPGARVFIFKAAGGTFSGIVCGPCDDPDSVFRIEDGRLSGGNRATFFLRHDSFRDQITATLAPNQLTMQARREGAADAPVMTTLARRVIEGFELAVQPQALAFPIPLPRIRLRPSAAAGGSRSGEMRSKTGC